MSASDLVLHMFPASHFNEKARWALDWKGLLHQRVSYLPGPHMPLIKRLSGQTQTPVLVMNRRVIAGSARIIEELERAYPERPLYPTDAVARARALEIQQRFDDEVGPAVRTALFSVLIHEPGYLSAMFTRTQPALKRALFRATLPLVKPLIAKGNGVNAANVERSLARTQQALEETARMIGPSGQIVGNAFSVADLAVASLLAPLVNVAHPDMARPLPIPSRMAEFYARFEKHAAVQWVRDQYAKHRPATSERADQISGDAASSPR
jgi:glutathione S-transferase